MATQHIAAAASKAAALADSAQSTVSSANGIANAAASAVTSAGEGVKAAGHAVADTASAVANSPTTAKVGGFMADKMMKYWQAAEDLTKQIVPQALDAILWVIRVDAISALATAFALIIAFYLGYRGIKKWYTHFDAKAKESDEWQQRDNANFTKWLGSIILSAVLGFTVLVSNSTWLKAFDTWTYVTIYEPKLYLAKIAVDGGTQKIKEMMGTADTKQVK
jgi:hypothetical protein